MLLRLAVDDRWAALLRRDLVAAFQRRAEIFRLRHILTVRAESFADLVVAHVLLEQIQAHRDPAAAIAQPSIPSVVVADDHSQTRVVQRAVYA